MMILSVHVYIGVIIQLSYTLATGEPLKCLAQGSLNSPSLVATRIINVDTYGCRSARTKSGSTNRIAHLIQINSGKNRNVTVHLREVKLNTDFGVLILKSDSTTTWEIRDHSVQKRPRKLLLIIDRGSRMKNLDRSKFKVQKRFLPSRVQGLMSWTENSFSHVQSVLQIRDTVSEIQYYGNSGITTTCNHVSVLNGTSTRARRYEVATTTGCHDTTQEGASLRDIHILEATGIGAASIVNLSIVSATGETLDRNIIIFLKGSTIQLWTVTSQGIKGVLQIRTSNDIKVGTSSMIVQAQPDNVSNVSGQNLIDDVESKYWPVVSYINVGHVSSVQIRVNKRKPSNREKRLKSTELPQTVYPSPFINQTVTKLLLDQTKTIKCLNSGMIILLSKEKLRAVGITANHLSLQDNNCLATSNTSHFILHTKLARCQTTHVTKINRMSFINSIHVNCLPQDEKYGCRDVSGSGSHGNLQLDSVDDEDLASPNSIVSPFNCSYLVGATKNTDSDHGMFDRDVASKSGDMFALTMYRDSLYLRRNHIQPLVVSPSVPIYIEARLANLSDSNRGIVVQKCWLSDVKGANVQNIDSDSIFIENGCPAVKWYVDMMPVPKSGVVSSSKRRNYELIRFSFFMKPFSTKNIYYLKCQMDVCSKTVKIGRVTVDLCLLGPHCSGTSDTPSALSQVIELGPFSAKPNNVIKVVKTMLDNTPMQDSNKPKGRVISNNKETSTIKPGTARLKIVQGLDTGTVVWIAFAAFAVGVLLTATLWFIHRQTDPVRRQQQRRLPTCTHHQCRHSESSGESTPCSSMPIHRPARR